MAACYHCGAGGANYRRNVSTGSSFGTFVSKRSYGSSSRTYYGLRTVCESCAADVDRQNLIGRIITLSIVIIVMLYFLMK